MDLSGTNYKFMKQKNALLEFMYLCFEVYGLKWHKLQVD